MIIEEAAKLALEVLVLASKGKVDSKSVMDEFWVGLLYILIDVWVPCPFVDMVTWNRHTPQAMLLVLVKYSLAGMKYGSGHTSYFIPHIVQVYIRLKCTLIGKIPCFHKRLPGFFKPVFAPFVSTRPDIEAVISSTLVPLFIK